jgi:hypothetical protein
MNLPMSRTMIAKYLAPWAFRREEEQQRFHALRHRDGDNCRRCRRPMRFDVPQGHEQGPRIEHILPSADGAVSVDNLCLCHVRCNALGGDQTGEVKERIRRKNEAELFTRARKRGKAA